MRHELKIQSQYFERVLNGSKTFEVRFDDRGFQAGDRVLLREISEFDGYTDRQMEFAIGYVTNFEQKPGWVVFSLLPIKEEGK